MMAAASGSEPTMHATAIVLGETGVLFIGPSGSGKSAAAFACLCAAQARGWNAGLIADDRTVLTAVGHRLVASCPEPIRGLIELRGAGIVRLRHVERAVIHLAVTASGEARLPEEEEIFTSNGIALPLLRMCRESAADPLSVLRGLAPGSFFAQ